MVCDVSYKTLTGAKPLRLRFKKVDGFIRIYDRIKYLVLFGLKKYDASYDRIRNHIEWKSDITYVFCHDFGKIKLIQAMLYL